MGDGLGGWRRQERSWSGAIGEWGAGGGAQRRERAWGREAWRRRQVGGERSEERGMRPGPGGRRTT